jgi:hypothetical protein
MNEEDRKWLNVDRFDTLLPKRKNGRWHPIRTDIEYPAGRNPDGGPIGNANTNSQNSNASETTTAGNTAEAASAAGGSGGNSSNDNSNTGVAAAAEGGNGGNAGSSSCASPDARSIPYGGALGGGTAAAADSSTDVPSTDVTTTETEKESNGSSDNGNGNANGCINDANSDPAPLLKSVEIAPKKPAAPVFNKCEVEIILKGVSSLKQFDCLLFQNW